MNESKTAASRKMYDAQQRNILFLCRSSSQRLLLSHRNATFTRELPD
jgi:hypothetical protein